MKNNYPLIAAAIFLLLAASIYFLQKPQSTVPKEELYHGTSDGSLEDYYNAAQQLGAPVQTPTNDQNSVANQLLYGDAVLIPPTQ